jgi:methyl-accepting chemotaxis protein
VEQSQGIGQIGHAVSQLDHVTQQNAALVDESAAESLKHQATSLSQTVAMFKLDSHEPAL